MKRLCASSKMRSTRATKCVASRSGTSPRARPAALTDAKNAERRFDDALDEADYALAHNAPRPRQEDLFGGAL